MNLRMKQEITSMNLRMKEEITYEPENERRNYLHEPETIQPKETIKTINTQTRIINKKINEHPGTGYLPSSLPPSSRPKGTIKTINTPMQTVTREVKKPYETSPNTGIKKKKPYKFPKRLKRISDHFPREKTSKHHRHSKK